MQDITLKWMDGSYPILGIVIFRTQVAMPVTLVLFRVEGAPRRRYRLSKRSPIRSADARI